jgi:hypothetical protein
MKTKYRFSHRSDDGLTYHWVASQQLPGDSRTEHVRCSVEWFWNAPPFPRIHLAYDRMLPGWVHCNCGRDVDHFQVAA